MSNGRLPSLDGNVEQESQNFYFNNAGKVKESRNQVAYVKSTNQHSKKVVEANQWAVENNLQRLLRETGEVGKRDGEKNEGFST